MFRENIGENLRKLRKRHAGLSVAKVVDRINNSGYEISADTYYKWERGTRKPPCEAIPYIAQALGTTEGRIFHLHEKMPKKTAGENERLIDDTVRLPSEVTEVLKSISEGKEMDVYSIFFLAGMCAAMSKRDQELVTRLILRLYEFDRTDMPVL